MSNALVPILYQPGVFGTYLEWVLTTLASGTAVTDPFTSTGSSHNYVGQQLINPTAWKQYIGQQHNHQFARVHIKTQQDHSIAANTEQVLNDCDFAILLYPDRNSWLFTLNNSVEKVWDNWWSTVFANCTFDQALVYKNWEIDQSVSIQDVPVWIRREFLSHAIVPYWNSLMDWYLPDTWSHPRCKIITVDQLLYNFEETLITLESQLPVKYQMSVQDLVPSHKKMLSLQKFHNQDLLCERIVRSTLSAEEVDWSDLPIASQSWVQWRLRTLGHEIRCHGLDKFPTNSLQLQELIYHI